MAEMPVQSIFPFLGIARSQVHWEEYLHALTPVVRGETLSYKREDTFAPLGMGGINGAKLRQCIWLIYRYVARGGRAGVLSGASVQSPQLCMCSAVAAHYGLQSLHVIGATRPQVADRHESVSLAARFGARFVFTKVAYNPVLQRTVQLLHANAALCDYMVLEYGITLSHTANPPAAIEAFHGLGAQQVQNIPDDIDTLVIPTGSANTAVGVLYGLARHMPPRLRQVYLIGIGPSKVAMIEERLAIIERVTGIATRPYWRSWPHHAALAATYPTPDQPVYELVHHDLHGTRYVSYQDRVPWQQDGIALHPTYEGKVLKYLHAKLPHLLKPTTLLWIVGGEPRARAMAPFLGDWPAAPIVQEVYA